MLFVVHVAVVARPIPLYIAVIWRTLLTNADRLVGRAIPSGCRPTLAGASSDRLQYQQVAELPPRRLVLPARVAQDRHHSSRFVQHCAPCICRARATHIVKFRSISRRHEVVNGGEALCEQNAEFHRDRSFPLANSSVG
ncbi:hypothetical protein MES4922_640006 [Mesorhizobium ventifaucium]|uniref:Secreted protein n=1 Tax=Mesorhizobium ventifaucium TaxID=666020 RepID=A0ABN8KD93_9HYPH|nr:hypothetical protein MES4922_640006 [Mesorhizobium ventifaucium]